MGDMGAEVICVEPPNGPRLKTPASAMLSRGKAVLKLDLTQANDR
ncbi:MAG: hypothetical protein RIC87_16660 [Kiloniellales bacterium]